MTDTGSPEETRHAMADRLVQDGWVRSRWVEEAFRAVPREKFAPVGTPLADCYPGDKALILKKDENGRNISSISAPWLQARMMEQAGLQPGMKVLEIGSGGCNAAYLAEVVGSDGVVVSMDIDPEITRNAVVALDAAGYADRVTVVTADAAAETAPQGPFDAIIVTVGMWDIPPVLLQQLVPGAPIVLPLRMNGVTRSLGLWPQGDHWRSISAQVCGFVPAQGLLGKEPEVLSLECPGAEPVELSFEDGMPSSMSLDNGVLGSGPVSSWSGITMPGATSFADLHLWLSGQPGFCRIAAGEDAGLAGSRNQGDDQRRFPFGLVTGDSIAYLGTRKVGEDAWEFGAWGYGPSAKDAASEFIAQVAAWDKAGRDLPPDAFSYHEAGADLSGLPDSAVKYEKTFGTAVITWPNGNAA